MKFFRLGSSLALLMAGLACTQSPQSTTGPSATTGAATSATAAADGSTLKVTPPGLVSPVDGVRAEDRRPTIVWTNADGKYVGIGVAYDIQVSTPTTVVYEMTVGETPDFGAHAIPFDLDYDTVYSWRVRAHLGDLVGPWSNWASFLSPTRPVVVATPGGAGPLGSCAAPVSPLGPGETRKPRPNDSRIVQQVASAFPTAFAHSCQEHYGAAGWEFMDRVVDALRAHDGRYGYNAKRGNTNDPSQDVASYYYGADPNAFQGSSQVYIFDLIAGHCGPTPSTFWGDVTDITNSSGTIGRTIYPRPGRVVDTSACAK